MDFQPRHSRLRDQPFSVQWRTALVQSPRYAPRATLHLTCSGGPFPTIVKLPSRTNEPRIPVWVWLPPAPVDIAAVPVHIDFHGGGFFMGSPLEQAPFCARLARDRNIVVMSVDFCQGPRYQFPAALHDAEDVLNAVLDTDQKTEAGRVLRAGIRSTKLPSHHIHQKTSRTGTASDLKLDPNRLSLSGFSSGGNIALNLVLSTTPNKESSETHDSSRGSDSEWPCSIPPSASPIPLILYYPSLDMRQLPQERPQDSNVPASGSFAKGLNKVLGRTYIPEEYKEHPRVSPGHLDTGGISERARVFLVLAELDTLAVQSNEWVEKMRKGGHGDRLEIYMGKGMKHGWCNLPEPFISKDARRQKREAYAKMMKFWDNAINTQEGSDEKKEPG